MRTHSLFPGSTSFLILLALAEGPATGATIHVQIVADTMGGYVKKSTLYDDLKRLISAGYVELVTAHGSEKVITLTRKGEKRLLQEVKLLQLMATTARERTALL